MLRVVLSIFGYIGLLYIGASTFYISVKIVEALSNKSIKSSSRFLRFVSLHDYGFGIFLWLFLMFVSVCSVFYINADRRSKSERDEDYQAAYEEGFSTGREEGYSSGRSEGYDVARSEFEGSGFDEGYEAARIEYMDSGYGDGYNSGFEDGAESAYVTGYTDGYRWGYEDGSHGKQYDDEP